MNDGSVTTIPGGEYADVGSRLNKAFSIYLANPAPFLLIAAINLPIGIVSAVWKWGFLLSIPAIFVGVIIGAAISHGTYQSITGQRPSFSASMSAAMGKIGPLVEFTLRSWGAFILLCITVVGFPFGIRILVRWFLGAQSIVLYGDGAVEAISRSVRLVTDNWWRVAGNLILVFLLVASVGIVLSFVGGTIPAVVGAVWGAVAAPLSSIFVTLLFLRLAQEKGEDPPPADIAVQA